MNLKDVNFISHYNFLIYIDFEINESKRNVDVAFVDHESRRHADIVKTFIPLVHGDLCILLCARKTIFWRFLVLDSIDSSQTIISQF